MDRETGRLPEWAHDEALKLELIRGEPRLAGMWDLAAQLASKDEIEARFEVMRMILEVAGQQGRFDHTLRAFGEMRRIHLSDGRYAHLRKRVLWYFKWMVHHLPEHAEVPRETIEKVFEDMTGFYRVQGESLRPVYGLRCHAAICMGDREGATRWFEKWQAEPPGDSDDCRACELDQHISYLLYLEQPEEAMRVAEPILKIEVYCTDTPATWTRLAGTALQVGDRKTALIFARMSEKRVRKLPGMLASTAAHAMLQTFFGRTERARRLAFVALKLARSSRNDVDRFKVYRSCGLWASLTTLVLPTALGLPGRAVPGNGDDSGEIVPLPEIASRCLEEAAGVAQRLDQRNGSTRYSDQLQELDSAIRKMVETMEARRSTRG